MFARQITDENGNCVRARYRLKCNATCYRFSMKFLYRLKCFTVILASFIKSSSVQAKYFNINFLGQKSSKTAKRAFGERRVTPMWTLSGSGFESKFNEDFFVQRRTYDKIFMIRFFSQRYESNSRQSVVHRAFLVAGSHLCSGTVFNARCFLELL